MSTGRKPGATFGVPPSAPRHARALVMPPLISVSYLPRGVAPAELDRMRALCRGFHLATPGEQEERRGEIRRLAAEHAIGTPCINCARFAAPIEEPGCSCTPEDKDAARGRFAGEL